jgi:hypothetical protein
MHWMGHGTGQRRLSQEIYRDASRLFADEDDVMSQSSPNAELLKWWEIVFTHEGGHAVASVVKFGHISAITAQNPEGGTRKATFKYNFEVMHFIQAPLNQVIRNAAGGVAEKELLGVESQGMVKDMGQNDRSLMACPQHKEIVEKERNANFPETTKFVQTHAEAIRAVAKAAFTRLTERRPEWIEGHFEETPILTAEEVQQLVEANKPDAQQAEDATTPA